MSRYKPGFHVAFNDHANDVYASLPVRFSTMRAALDAAKHAWSQHKTPDVMVLRDLDFDWLCSDVVAAIDWVGNIHVHAMRTGYVKVTGIRKR